ncbi:hypothetical protein V6Z12_D10G162400 [Gossypium hirsutum]
MLSFLCYLLLQMRKNLDFFNPEVSAKDSPARDGPFLVPPFQC